MRLVIHLLLLVSMVRCGYSASITVMADRDTSELKAPLSFFTANSNLINAVVSGSGGSSSASNAVVRFNGSTLGTQDFSLSYTGEVFAIGTSESGTTATHNFNFPATLTNWAKLDTNVIQSVANASSNALNLVLGPYIVGLSNRVDNLDGSSNQWQVLHGPQIAALSNRADNLDAASNLWQTVHGPQIANNSNSIAGKMGRLDEVTTNLTVWGNVALTVSGVSSNDLISVTSTNPMPVLWVRPALRTTIDETNKPDSTLGVWGSISVSATNDSYNNVQSGYMTSRNYLGAGANNVVFGSYSNSLQQQPNVRIQADGNLAHVGLNIGGTPYSGMSYKNTSTGDAYLGLLTRGKQTQTVSTGETFIVSTTAVGTVISNDFGSKVIFPGSVGIGTNAPDAGVKLHVLGNSIFDGTITLRDVLNYAEPEGKWHMVNSNGLFSLLSADGVTRWFDIGDTIEGMDFNPNYHISAGAFIGKEFHASGAATTSFPFEVTPTTGSANDTFRIYDTNGTTVEFVVSSNGWVGVNTGSTPTNTLDVSGHTSLRSNVFVGSLSAIGGGNAVDANGNLYATNSTGIAGAGGGSSGPTTNAPPYTIAIDGGLGSTNIVLDMLALGPTNVVRATLTSNAGFIVTNVIDGMSITMELIQDGTGSRTLTTNATWGFNIRFGQDLPDFSLTSTADRKDLYKVIGSGTNALIAGAVRGFSL